MKATDDETKAYALMGMAALLPGMVHMLELMQSEVDNFRTRLAAMQGEGSVKAGKAARRKAEVRPGRLPSGWPADPEARKVEMARRMSNRNRKKESTELSKQRKAAWAALSPQKRKKRLAAMIAGRKAKQPVVRMEKVA
jgi:hypothetical protein